MDDLIKIDEEAKEQMDNAFYGGLDANENQQKMAEVHFEAWMRLLDSRVTDVSLKECFSFSKNFVNENREDVIHVSVGVWENLK